MNVFEFLTVATAIGCGTAVMMKLITGVAAIFTRPAAREGELRLAEERASRQELRIAELVRQNEQLHDQLVPCHASFAGLRHALSGQTRGSAPPARTRGRAPTPLARPSNSGVTRH